MGDAHLVERRAPGIGGRADRAKSHGRKRQRAAPVGVRVARQIPRQQQVRALVAHFTGGRHRQADADIGMLAVEHRQLRHQPAHREGRAAGHVQPRALGFTAQSFVSAFQLVERGAHRRVEGRARGPSGAG
ncbi:hypothetical protein G6F24_016521 [Rhizopus arrhizus]|nr:hypothetical protein G6F24_016521 [Rhizopus arrhizus]